MTPGAILDLAPSDRKWVAQPLRMQVTQVRQDLMSAHNEDTEVWLEGFELDERGQPVRRCQELVRLDVLASLAGNG